jgi:hypothetical protein
VSGRASTESRWASRSSRTMISRIFDKVYGSI